MLLLIPAAISQGTWQRIAVPTGQNLRSVCFADSLTGWIAGDSGTIIHTTDGGKNWSFQQSNTFNNIVHIFFLNQNLGWAVAHNFSSVPYGTLLLRTWDGGYNWTSHNYPAEDIFMNCVFYLDSLTGWMGGSPHAIVRTVDGGYTWQDVTVDTSLLAFFPVLSIKFYNYNWGYASGGLFEIAGVTWRTSDGGDTWFAIDATDAPADEIHEIHLFDSVTVMGAGGDPDFGFGVGMIRTFDGGSNWEYEEVGIQGNAFDLDFRNDDEAWAPLGSRAKLIYSLDGGDSWAEIATPESTMIFDMTFPDSLHGYGVGMDGAILKYLPPVYVGIKTTVEPDPVKIRIYPNPVRESTIIDYQLSIDGEVRISVYDPAGSLVMTSYAGEQTKGSHSIRLLTGDMPKGVYICVIQLQDPDGKPKGRNLEKMIVF